MQDMPEIALAWHREGRSVALATVIETWGSAPRRVGAQLAINDAGSMEGSVSGGCVEGAVVLEALDAIKEDRARILEFGVSDGDAFAVGLACGGTIRVLVEPVGAVLSVPMLEALVAARAARRPVAYVINTISNARTLVEHGFPQRFRLDRSGFEPDGTTFVAVHNPPLRLIVVGAVHIAQTLVPMARAIGYDPVVIDPRDSFASSARFPDTQLLHDWPDEAVADLKLDGRTAVVLLSHDPKLDDPALIAAMQSEVFYIGALGSKRTQASRIDRMTEAGFSEDDCARIHGPVGLDIGASGPAEIALAILAEMTRVLRRGA